MCTNARAAGQTYKQFNKLINDMGLKGEIHVTSPDLRKLESLLDELAGALERSGFQHYCPPLRHECYICEALQKYREFKGE